MNFEEKNKKKRFFDKFNFLRLQAMPFKNSINK